MEEGRVREDREAKKVDAGGLTVGKRRMKEEMHTGRVWNWEEP